MDLVFGSANGTRSDGVSLRLQNDIVDIALRWRKGPIDGKCTGNVRGEVVELGPCINQQQITALRTWSF